jgi:hypothetical protein
MPKAKQAAHKALELDPSNGKAHASLLFAGLYDPDWSVVQREVDEATRLSPNDANTFVIASIAMMDRDLPQALRLSKHGYDLDPSDPLIAFGYAYQLLMSGLSDSAAKVSSVILARDPTAVLGRYVRHRRIPTSAATRTRWPITLSSKRH